MSSGPDISVRKGIYSASRATGGRNRQGQSLARARSTAPRWGGAARGPRCAGARHPRQARRRGGALAPAQKARGPAARRRGRPRGARLAALLSTRCNGQSRGMVLSGGPRAAPANADTNSHTRPADGGPQVEASGGAARAARGPEGSVLHAHARARADASARVGAGWPLPPKARAAPPARRRALASARRAAGWGLLGGWRVGKWGACKSGLQATRMSVWGDAPADVCGKVRGAGEGRRPRTGWPPRRRGGGCVCWQMWVGPAAAPPARAYRQLLPSTQIRRPLSRGPCFLSPAPAGLENRKSKAARASGARGKPRAAPRRGVGDWRPAPRPRAASEGGGGAAGKGRGNGMGTSSHSGAPGRAPRAALQGFAVPGFFKQWGDSRERWLTQHDSARLSMTRHDYRQGRLRP